MPKKSTKVKSKNNNGINLGIEVLSTGGAPNGCDNELRPFVGRTLMASIFEETFKGEL